MLFSQISKKSLSQLLKKRPPTSQIKQIHAQIITQSLSSSHLCLIDSLIHCYLHTRNLNTARALFNGYPLPSPPTLLWNLMIRACSKLQDLLEPIYLLRRMLNLENQVGVVPDDYTFNFVITSSTRQNSIVYGEVLHGMVIKYGWFENLCVANSLINMYGVFGKVDDAYAVFDKMSDRDVFSWTGLVSAYAKNGEMCRAGEIFVEMPVKNEVSWAVMISGFVGCGKYVEALSFFHEMTAQMRPNEAVLVCSLSACAHLGSLSQGNWIHGYIDRKGIVETSNVKTALIDMYAKCGKIDCAYGLFNNIPRPDVHNFTSLISGLSIHGLGDHVIQVFRRMLAEKLKPNGITVLGVLNGCSHSGLVHHGSSVFYNMEDLWGITPKIEHYGCYIDLLGRAGYLAKAFGVAKSMPVNPDVAVWRALLSACRIHRSSDFGERVINHLEQLDPGCYDGGKVLLSNLYASLGKWDKVAQIRNVMGSRKNQSDIGCSWIEINGVFHEFRVADVLHPQIVEIQNKLAEIIQRIGLVGYSADAAHVSFDISEEDKAQAVSWHGEKLAVAFGLMNTLPRTSLRIVKNLRTCDDCHLALKAISKVYDREIIVRDRCRFHTFNQGYCSCNEYW
ncbi:pentatricopeptide repeat-containing protein At3g62890-like [Henckelia pumila]|uniref:pentatricopeptide repeat-containing protein At3g62890-like n=1 Tax=Henckelia pumila TaxID=405737 RepID=UPI003C6EA2F7